MRIRIIEKITPQQYTVRKNRGERKIPITVLFVDYKNNDSVRRVIYDKLKRFAVSTRIGWIIADFERFEKFLKKHHGHVSFYEVLVPEKLLENELRLAERKQGSEDLVLALSSLVSF